MYSGCIRLHKTRSGAWPRALPSGSSTSPRHRPRRARIGTLQTFGFGERLHRTVLEEFFVEALCTSFYETFSALQADLDAWLVCYDTERPHQGYRNVVRRPIDTVNLFVKAVSREV